MVVHLQQDGAGAGHVPVALLKVLDGAVVEVLTVLVVSGQSPCLPCQSAHIPPQLPVAPLLLRLAGLLPEVGQLAEQSRELQLTPSLL